MLPTKADARPMSRMMAYAHFVQTCREEHKKKYPEENVIFAKFFKKCAERWKTMLDKEKKRFHEMTEKDKGTYMCQIKTVIAKTQLVYKHVLVLPNIDDSLSNSDVIAREGASETLTCKATGSPPTTVKWKRDDHTKIAINNALYVLEWDGKIQELTCISRLDMGAYLCIDSNAAPPTISN